MKIIYIFSLLFLGYYPLRAQDFPMVVKNLTATATYPSYVMDTSSISYSIAFQGDQISTLDQLNINFYSSDSLIKQIRLKKIARTGRFKYLGDNLMSSSVQGYNQSFALRLPYAVLQNAVKIGISASDYQGRISQEYEQSISRP